MTFFGLNCCCTEGNCPDCFCGDTPPSPISAEQTFWGEDNPNTYCEICDDLNNVIGLTSVVGFTSGPGGFGDAHDFYYKFPACAIGNGCRWEEIEEFDCTPHMCYECEGGCGSSCTADADCTEANCDPDFWSCGAADIACQSHGGSTCELDCNVTSTCVFDEETDPEHLFGVCTMTNCEVLSVINCTKIARYTRLLIYTATDGSPVLSVQVILFGLTGLFSLQIATILTGAVKVPSSFNCNSFSVEVPLEPAPSYVQPTTPPCLYTLPSITLSV